MFDKSFLKFFRALAKNNNRDWFNEHKAEYKAVIVEPLCTFITAIAPRLNTISKHFNADPRPNGGSMFRIYRDIRFSKDKTPYKLHAACQFRHLVGKDAHAPGFYVNISPDEVIFGGGIWMPPNPVLNKIRDTIVENPNEWQRIKTNKAIQQKCGGIRGDGLVRPPKGFDVNHPHLEDLKRKSFFAMRHDKADIIYNDNFIDEVEATFKVSKPFMKYLCFALDVPF
ncbi:MAG: hypothetical protein ACI9SC_002081 [Gammaproteobacteria bacterium]|jgi:uncharacterized protein (TIGR02453 family)